MSLKIVNNGSWRELLRLKRKTKNERMMNSRSLRKLKKNLPSTVVKENNRRQRSFCILFFNDVFFFRVIKTGVEKIADENTF